MPVSDEAPKATSLLTPGAMFTMLDVNWLLGMFRRISLDSVTEAVSVDLTSTVGDWATTVTSSLTAAGFSCTSNVSVVVVVMRIFSRTSVPKPWSSNLSWNSPGGMAGNRNSPVGSVTAVRTPMRLTPESVTLTPGRGEFCSSVTTPRTAPVSRDWEKAAGASRRAMAMRVKILFFNDASLSGFREIAWPLGIPFTSNSHLLMWATSSSEFKLLK